MAEGRYGVVMSARIKDANGWFEIAANPLSKVGIFQYLGSSIKAPDPNKVYNVYRPASELSSPETLASFRLVPWIEDHVMLGEGKPGYVPAEQKGVHGVTGENIWFNDAEGIMYGNIKAFSSSLQRTINNGKIDLSLGYVCKYDPTPGVYNGQPFDYVQRNIRGNHMASVQDGRMGDDVVVQDSLTVTFDAKDILMTVKTPSPWLAFQQKKLATMRTALSTKTALTPVMVATMDAEEAEAGSPTLEDVASLLKDVMPQIADINEAMAAAAGGGGDDDMEPEMDAAGKPVMDAAGKPMMKKKVAPAAVAATPAATATDGKAPVMDQAAMDSAIAKAISTAVTPLLAKIADLETNGAKRFLGEVALRDAMAGKLSHFVGTFDAREMTLIDVAKYGVTKLELPATAGHEVSAVTAFLHNRPLPNTGTGMDAGIPVATGSMKKYLEDSAAA